VNPPTLLIVDDNPVFREFARRMLEAAGFRVIGTAADGASAIERARQLKPDVVLLDIVLPDSTGFEVCDALRQVAPAIAVVLTSSRDVATYRRRLESSTARGFVPKDRLSAGTISAVLR
jgi:two-component system response regulator DegU